MCLVRGEEEGGHGRGAPVGGGPFGEGGDDVDCVGARGGGLEWAGVGVGLEEGEVVYFFSDLEGEVEEAAEGCLWWWMLGNDLRFGWAVGLHSLGPFHSGSCIIR